MKKILVPTDFSKNAFYALENAFVLADQQPGTELVLFHNITPFQQFVPNFWDNSYFLDYCKLKEQRLQKTIEEVKGEHDSYTKIATKAVYDVGNTVENIINYCKTNKIDLIVSANTGNTAIKEITWGSIAMALLGNADKPVLVFPHKASIQKMFDNVLVAIDINYPLTPNFVHNFDAIFQESNTKFKVVSIIQNDDELKIQQFETDIRKKLKKYDMQFYYIKDEHVAKAILQFAEDTQSELICLIGHQRNRFSKLFSGSTVNKIAPKINRPLLIIPE